METKQCPICEKKFTLENPLEGDDVEDWWNHVHSCVKDTDQKRKLGNENLIEMYFHCKLCLEEEISQDIEAGWTVQGFQVWRRNHDCNIENMDFEGQKHPANENRKFSQRDIHTVK